MKRILILIMLGLFLCSTAGAFQDGAGEPPKPPKPPKPPIKVVVPKTVPKIKIPITKRPLIPKRETKVPPASPEEAPPASPEEAPPASPEEAPPAEPELPTTASLTVNVNLPNVSVRINGNYTGTTDSNGNLVIPELTPGFCTVSVAKPGYQPQAVILDLSAGQSETTRFEMKSSTQSLTISSTPPGSDIYIDDILRGRTDAFGSLRLAGLPVGEYRVAIRKDRYKEKVLSLSLSPDVEGQINGSLEWAVGFLTVTTNVPDSGIDISGLGRFDNRVNKFECPPGTYSVTISSPLYVTSRKDVIVSGGQEAELSVDLVADTEARSLLATEFLEAYTSRQYDQAITLAKTLLSVDPNNVQALTVLAKSYFMKDDFDSFTESARQALEAGGSLEIPLKHQHSNKPADMHPVRIVLTGQTVSFDPQVSQLPPGSSCPNPAFTRSLNILSSSELSGNLDNEIYLQLVFAEPGNPKKPTTLRFADRESNFVKEAKNTVGRGIRYDGKTMNSRQQAYGAMKAISTILSMAQAGINPHFETPITADKASEVIHAPGAPYPGIRTTATARPSDYVVPYGAIFIGILQNEIDTKNSQNNDRFRMTVQSPDQFRDAIIEGYISGVRRSGKVTGQSSITFNFAKITLRNGQTYDFAGTLQSIKDHNGKTVKVDNEGTAKGNSKTKETIKRGGIGAGIGAVIGGILGGAGGAAAGAAIGGAAGAGSAAVQNEDIKLKKGSTISLQSSSPIRRN